MNQSKTAVQKPFGCPASREARISVDMVRPPLQMRVTFEACHAGRREFRPIAIFASKSVQRSARTGTSEHFKRGQQHSSYRGGVKCRLRITNFDGSALPPSRSSQAQYNRSELLTPFARAGLGMIA